MSERKKKILYYLMQGGSAGGSDTCLYLLIKFLDKTKYEPILLYKERSKFVDELEKLNVTLIPVPIKERKKNSKQTNATNTKQITFANNPSNLRIILSSIKHLVKRVPDIINLIKVIKDYNIDIVHANHYLTGDRSVLVASLLTKVKTISHNRGLYPPDPIDRIIAKKLDCIINMSDFSKSVYTKNGVSEEKCITIYDGIDTEEFKPNANESDEIIVGCFGRLEKWKGQQTLINAAELIVKSCINIKFIIVGNGPDEQDLKTSVKRKKLEDYFEFTGHITNVVEYMNKCTIIVHTSIEPEPFGMVITEAMALEKPVIATKIGGPIEIINDQEDGFLVTPQNPIELANVVINLSKENYLRHSIGLKARKKVLEKFDVKNYARKIAEIYEEITY
ncbi:MAG: glycosyltransferase [Ignavibacteriae bacterium]|nr:glycosyltransferase [Ignavibacteriota bacterium]